MERGGGEGGGNDTKTHCWLIMIAGQVSNAHALSSVTPREVKNSCKHHNHCAL